MLRRFLILAALVAACTVLSACGASSSASKPAAETASSSASANIADSSLPKTADLNAMARSYKSTPGRIALALIICRLDQSSYLHSLAPKSAKDLFTLLREVSTQDSQTLESLNTQFHLTDILASEGIYVQIHANAATSLPKKAVKPASNWIAQFESAYAALSSESSTP